MKYIILAIAYVPLLLIAGTSLALELGLLIGLTAGGMRLLDVVEKARHGDDDPSPPPG